MILGCTNQAGEDNRNVARMALLLAGLPVEVPGQALGSSGSRLLTTIVHALHRRRARYGLVTMCIGVG